QGDHARRPAQERPEALPRPGRRAARQPGEQLGRVPQLDRDAGQRPLPRVRPQGRGAFAPDLSGPQQARAGQERRGARTLEWRAGVEAEVMDIDLDKAGDANVSLLHLAGTAPTPLSSAQVAALEAYLKRGGTVLVENVGGRGDFARDFKIQWSKAHGVPPLPLM